MKGVCDNILATSVFIYCGTSRSMLSTQTLEVRKVMGLWTAVLDQNPNAPGVAYADAFFEVSTTDEAGVLEAATSFGADAIFTLATDQPMRAVAFASERLNLPGLTYDVAVRATDKFCQMEALKEKESNIGHRLNEAVAI